MEIWCGARNGRAKTVAVGGGESKGVREGRRSEEKRKERKKDTDSRGLCY